MIGKYLVLLAIVSVHVDCKVASLPLESSENLLSFDALPNTGNIGAGHLNLEDNDFISASKSLSQDENAGDEFYPETVVEVLEKLKRALDAAQVETEGEKESTRRANKPSKNSNNTKNNNNQSKTSSTPGKNQSTKSSNSGRDQNKSTKSSNIGKNHNQSTNSSNTGRDQNKSSKSSNTGKGQNKSTKSSNTGNAQNQSTKSSNTGRDQNQSTKSSNSGKDKNKSSKSSDSRNDKKQSSKSSNTSDSKNLSTKSSDTGRDKNKSTKSSNSSNEKNNSAKSSNKNQSTKSTDSGKDKKQSKEPKQKNSKSSTNDHGSKNSENKGSGKSDNKSSSSKNNNSKIPSKDGKKDKAPSSKGKDKGKTKDNLRDKPSNKSSALDLLDYKGFIKDLVNYTMKVMADRDFDLLLNTDIFLTLFKEDYEALAEVAEDNDNWDKYVKSAVENFYLEFNKIYFNLVHVQSDSGSEMELYNKAYDLAMFLFATRKNFNAVKMAAPVRRIADVIKGIIGGPIEMVQTSCKKDMPIWQCNVAYLSKLIAAADSCPNIWFHSLVLETMLEYNRVHTLSIADPITKALGHLKSKSGKSPMKDSSQVHEVFDSILKILLNTKDSARDSLQLRAKLYQFIIDLQNNGSLDCTSIGTPLYVI